MNSTKIAYFAPDLADPAVHRRVAQWRHAGHQVLAFAFARNGAKASPPPGYVSLGQLAHQSRLTRLVALGLALPRLLRWQRALAETRLFIARNMDNAALALFARWMAGSSAPLIYEVLDINASCTGPSRAARLLRRLEKWLLGRVNLLVVSSPHFISAYYQCHLGYTGHWLLFENKVPRYVRLPRSDLPTHRGPGPRVWRIGWFGFLDDERSWRTLRRLAERLPQDVAVHVRGLPYNNFDMDSFLADIARLDNIFYGGDYKSPDDLPAIYGAVDIVWSADLNDLSANSRWLLTNALYEALYFGKPVIGLAGTAVGEFLLECGSGWCLDDPVEDSLVALFSQLTEAMYVKKCAAIASISRGRFVETDEVERISRILRAELAKGAPPSVSEISMGMRTDSQSEPLEERKRGIRGQDSGTPGNGARLDP